MRIALIGTRGVPARYGGFETCVEEVGRRLVTYGHDVVVYCRTGAEPDGEQPRTHLGMRLVHLPAVHSKVAETLSHTALSVAHLAAHPVDAAIVFNAANSPLLPVIRALGIPVATHVDGLEWKRAKWGGNGRRFYRRAESLAVRWSDALIADARGIADYYLDEFGADTELIAYGAPVLVDPGHDRLTEVGLTPRGYHLVVARFEPENHVDMIVDGYTRSGSTLPLVVVGSAPYSEAYTAKVYALADNRVRFLGAVWDQTLLDQLYGNAFTYVHGHSVGGTNPSLLRAMGAGAPVVAFDVNFNVEVANGGGRYFRDGDDVRHLLEGAEADPAATLRRGEASVRAAADYDWDDVALRYEKLCAALPGRRADRAAGRLHRPTGARGAAAVRVPPAEKPTTGFLCSDFDMLHVGDLRAVEQAQGQCDRLVAGVLSDRSVLDLTGREPVIGQNDRATLIRHVRGVDDVVIVDDVDPGRWRRLYDFDVLFDGPATGLTLSTDRLPTIARLVSLAGAPTTSAPLLDAVEARWGVADRTGSLATELADAEAGR